MTSGDKQCGAKKIMLVGVKLLHKSELIIDLSFLGVLWHQHFHLQAIFGEELPR